ncbi:MAG: phenylacetate--CoA ligase [Planctomycetota bacterium]|nr:MAG: phenylacetate--CoA ligase [Planctomycetota bacterium]REK37528.1 MAG: phenylacetate--CoA ligase [Planctomycetota bacterium]
MDGTAFPAADQPDRMSRDELRALQVARLRWSLERAKRVPLFQHRLAAAGVAETDVGSIDDIARLPFVKKADLRDNYPDRLFAVPREQIVRLHASSGTTGKPIVVAYTRHDLEVWTEVMARTLAYAGVGSSDTVQNAFGYGLFTGGLGAHYGAERLGATVVPTSGGNTDRQLTVLADFGVTAICATPSYFLHLVDRAESLGIDLPALPLRKGIFGAEPWSEAMRQRIERAAGIEAFDIYGLSEIIGPGVAAESREHDGLYVFEDHFLPEIVDPESGEVLPEGEVGELVITTLSKEALPLIRYRTGDVTALVDQPGDGGRSFRRIRRISRRTDDMLIIRGVNVYPSQIEAALLAVEGTLPHYQIVLRREVDLDQLDVQIEAEPQVLEYSEAHSRLLTALEQTIRSVVGIRARVEVLPPQTLPRSEGKAKRVIDRREQ